MMSLGALRRLAGLPGPLHCQAMPMISLLSGGLLDRGDLSQTQVVSFASRSYQTYERRGEEQGGGGGYSAARRPQRPAPPPGRRRTAANYRQLLQHLARKKK